MPSLSHLLVRPLPLQLGIQAHPCLVAEVLTLKLATSRDVNGLARANHVCTLPRALHLPY